MLFNVLSAKGKDGLDYGFLPHYGKNNSFYASIAQAKGITRIQEDYNVGRKRAEELQKAYNEAYNSFLASPKVNSTVEYRNLQKKIIDEINQEVLDTCSAKISTSNPLKTIQSNIFDSQISENEIIKKYSKELKTNFSLYKDIENQQSVQIRKLLHNAFEAQRAIATILQQAINEKASETDIKFLKEEQNKIKGIYQQIRQIIKDVKGEGLKRIANQYVNINEFKVQGQENLIIQLIDSMNKLKIINNSSSYANGLVGETVANLLIQLSGKKIEEIAETEVKAMVQKAIETSKEYGPKKDISIAISKEGNVYTGADLLERINKDANLKVSSHTNKIDTVIQYNFEDVQGTSLPTDIGLSVKNYNSFTDLTLVDGTPLKTTISYINGIENRDMMIGALLSSNAYRESTYKVRATSKLNTFKTIKANAKKALKMRIFSNALQGYGESIKGGTSKFPEFFVVFNNSAVKDPVKVINIPYAIYKYSDIGMDMGNFDKSISIILEDEGKRTVEDYNLLDGQAGVEYRKTETNDKGTSELLEKKTLQALQKVKVHVKLNQLNDIINRSSKI